MYKVNPFNPILIPWEIGLPPLPKRKAKPPRLATLSFARSIEALESLDDYPLALSLAIDLTTRSAAQEAKLLRVLHLAARRAGLVRVTRQQIRDDLERSRLI